MFAVPIHNLATMNSRRSCRWILLAFTCIATLAASGARADELDFGTVKSLADKGDVNAQLILGNMHLGGQGTAKSSVEAAKWFRKSAEQNNARAQSALGKLYAKGDGVGKDAGAAAKWLTAAAEQGLADAQAQLGLVLRDNSLGNKNWVEAYKWLNLAASAGDTAAERARDILANSMSALQITEAQRLSSEFTPVSSKPPSKKKDAPKKDAPKNDKTKSPTTKDVSKPVIEPAKTNAPAKRVEPKK